MLLETQRRGGTAVVFVDEAHLLSLELLEEIRLLSNADSYREKLLQIILCGQPELTAILHRPEMNALQQRVGASCVLRALSLAETRAYVAERLHAAGMRGPNPFSGPALENIHRYTKGVPRLINLVCLNCLTIAHAAGRHLVDPDIVEEASAQLGLVEMPAWVPAKTTTPVSELPEGTLLHTSVDVMIESMRKSRAAARG